MERVINNLVLIHFCYGPKVKPTAGARKISVSKLAGVFSILNIGCFVLVITKGDGRVPMKHLAGVEKPFRAKLFFGNDD